MYSNCAEKGPYGNRGGWWYNACTRSNLNGLNYAEGTAIDEWIGIYWYKFGGSRNSMKTVTMSVIPKNPCMYHLDFTKKTLKLGPFEFLEAHTSYTVRAIITRSLYIFYPIFQCGL